MTKKLIYLATPYSHTDPAVMEERYQLAMRAAATLMEKGNVVFSPIAHSHDIGKYLGKQAGGHLDQDIHAFWMAQDLPWLERCDIVMVLMLPGWQESRGVQEEIVYAVKHSKPVAYVSPSQLDLPASVLIAKADRDDLKEVWTARKAAKAYREAAARVDCEAPSTKATNPKDAVGIRKAPMSTVPAGVLAEIGVGMLEGTLKYGRHNYRAAGVRASVYYDAMMRHLMAWWEGEDLDPDTADCDEGGQPIPGTGLSHITKLITAAVVLRDAQMQDMCTDDRPPRSKPFYAELNVHAAAVIDRYADRNPRHYTIADSKVQP